VIFSLRAGHRHRFDLRSLSAHSLLSWASSNLLEYFQVQCFMTLTLFCSLCNWFLPSHFTNVSANQRARQQTQELGTS
jgi:hypothetical protein